jgi:hypothetical protein
VGSRPVAGDRDVRPAEGRLRTVRRHRPQGDVRRRRRRARAAAAASCPTSTAPARSTPEFLKASPPRGLRTATSCPRSSPHSAGT